MQSRVDAELLLSVKKNAASLSRVVADGRKEALAACAADIAGEISRRSHEGRLFSPCSWLSFEGRF
jgi:hypothetical protein